MFITNIPANDGFGSQFQNIISYILIADVRGYQFIYTPLIAVEHNYDNDPEFINQLESLMNIKNHYPVIGSNQINIFIGDPKKNYLDEDIKKYANLDSLQKIKNIFWENKNRNHFNNGCVNVAVHVRRPNICDNRIEGTDTSDQYYFTVINKIREIYPDAKFHIYSQGSIENFLNYCADDTVLHINESIENTFIGLVASDVLVMSASSFSYVAALLHDGIVFYHSFWHPPLGHWFIIN